MSEADRCGTSHGDSVRSMNHAMNAQMIEPINSSTIMKLRLSCIAGTSLPGCAIPGNFSRDDSPLQAEAALRCCVNALGSGPPTVLPPRVLYSIGRHSG